MSHTQSIHQHAVVVGASRGFGAGITAALAEHGLAVTAVARSDGDMPELATAFDHLTPVKADASEDGIAEQLLADYNPNLIVLNAGARPAVGTIQDQTWETFSINWDSDVRIAFNWIRAAVRKPLPPGSHIIVMSSGAAIAGSPLSGGYAGAKATLRTMAHMANDESDRLQLGITATTLHPALTPATGLGAPFIEAYAQRAGKTRDEFLDQLGEPIKPEDVGAAVLEVIDNPGPADWLLTPNGLATLPAPGQ